MSCDSLTENRVRAFGCHLIFESGVSLNLSSCLSCKACLILHSFYESQSVTAFDVRVVAAAALLLACKFEGEVRRIFCILQAVKLHYMRSIRSKAEDSSRLTLSQIFPQLGESPDYKHFFKQVTECEIQILIVSGFCLSRALEPSSMEFLFSFGGWMQIESGVLRKALQTLEELHFTRIVRWAPAHELAIAALYIADRSCKESNLCGTGEKWWEMAGISSERLEYIVEEGYIAYQQLPPPYYEDVLDRSGGFVPNGLDLVADFKSSAPPSAESGSADVGREEVCKNSGKRQEEQKKGRERDRVRERERERGRRNRSKSRDRRRAGDRDRDREREKERERDRDRDRRENRERSDRYTSSRFDQRDRERVRTGDRVHPQRNRASSRDRMGGYKGDKSYKARAGEKPGSGISEFAPSGTKSPRCRRSPAKGSRLKRSRSRGDSSPSNGRKGRWGGGGGDYHHPRPWAR